VRRFDEAITAWQDTAAIYRETGDRHGEDNALENLDGAQAAREHLDQVARAGTGKQGIPRVGSCERRLRPTRRRIFTQNSHAIRAEPGVHRSMLVCGPAIPATVARWEGRFQAGDPPRGLDIGRREARRWLTSEDQRRMDHA
jgi:hypothetical protein